jgi:putative membrane protein (TIGR04086 family)
LIFLLVAAGVAYANPDPDRLITPLGLGATALTALGGGFVSARRGQAAPALCGLLLGMFLTLLLFGGSLLLSDSTRSALSLGLTGLASFGLHAGVVVLATLGAIIGRPR